MWFCSNQVLKSGEGQVSAVNSHSTTSGFPKFASFQNFQNSGMKFLFRKLTYPLKINIWKKKLPFEMVPFFKACSFSRKISPFFPWFPPWRSCPTQAGVLHDAEATPFRWNLNPVEFVPGRAFWEAEWPVVAGKRWMGVGPPNKIHIKHPGIITLPVWGISP